MYKGDTPENPRVEALQKNSQTWNVEEFPGGKNY